MDVQTLLVITLLILTISLVGVSIYVIIVLKELRATLAKVNGVLSAGDLINKLKNPAQTIIELTKTVSETVNAVKSSVSTIADLTKEEKKKKS